jgi:hypothetical protein
MSRKPVRQLFDSVSRRYELAVRGVNYHHGIIQALHGIDIKRQGSPARTSKLRRGELFLQVGHQDLERSSLLHGFGNTAGFPLPILHTSPPF